MNSLKPNFILAGAPKCGTTSMWQYLNQHPEVFMCKPKEPNYFCDDFPRIRKVKTANEYFSLFNETDQMHRIRGEASALYFYSNVAAERIKKFNPDAKILLMLRNPVTMIPAWHAQLCFSGDEEICDLEEAWGAQLDRLEGRRIPRACRFPELLQLKTLGYLSRYVERFMQLWDEENICFILTDDLAKNFRLTMHKVYDFLGITNTFEVLPEIVNPRKVPRARWVTKMTRIQTPSWLRSTVLPARRLMGFERFGLRAILRECNRREVPRVAVSAKMQATLRDCYAEDVKRLQTMIDRDLSEWLN